MDPLLLEFQMQCTRTRKLLSDARQQCLELVEQLNRAAESAKEVESFVGYQSEEDYLQTRMEAVNEEEERVWSLCAQRERRWSLALKLNQFEPDVEKVI